MLVPPTVWSSSASGRGSSQCFSKVEFKLLSLPFLLVVSVKGYWCADGEQLRGGLQGERVPCNLLSVTETVGGFAKSSSFDQFAYFLDVPLEVIFLPNSED